MLEENQGWAGDHVHPDVQPLLHEDAEARIKAVQADQFIPFGKLPVILERMRQLVKTPNQGSPKGILLIGDSQMGKSELIKAFHLEHPADDNVNGEHAQIPVLVIQFPDSGGEGVYGEICRVLNVKLPNKPSPLLLRSETMSVLDRVGMKVLVIDELANVLTRREPTKATSLNQIKFIMNEHKRPVVLGVTEKAYRTIQHDEQISNRFIQIRLALPKGQDLAKLVLGWVRLQPLRRPSEIGEKFFALLNQLHAQYTGDLVWHLKQMAVAAIQTGEERLTYAGLVSHITLLESGGIESPGLTRAKEALEKEKAQEQAATGAGKKSGAKKGSKAKGLGDKPKAGKATKKPAKGAKGDVGDNDGGANGANQG